MSSKSLLSTLTAAAVVVLVPFTTNAQQCTVPSSTLQSLLPDSLKGFVTGATVDPTGRVVFTARWTSPIYDTGAAMGWDGNGVGKFPDIRKQPLRDAGNAVRAKRAAGTLSCESVG
jgi:hypothetical protein